MVMTPKELAETLATIADKAKALREAGVVGRVDVGDISFEIGVELTVQPSTSGSEESAPGNPLDDPDLYGGRIPQRRRPTRATEPEPDDDDE